LVYMPLVLHMNFVQVSVQRLLWRLQTAGTYPIARLALYSLPILVCLLYPVVGEQEISHQDQEIYRHQMNWLPYRSYYS
jgi:hypothetical protein